MPATVQGIRKIKTLRKQTEFAFQVLTAQNGIMTYKLTVHSAVMGIILLLKGQCEGRQAAGKVHRLHTPVRKSFRMTMCSFNYIYSTNMH